MSDTPVTSTPVSGGEVSQGADNSAPKATTAPSSTPQPANDGKWVLKINGKERIVTEAEARSHLAKELAADEKFQKASQMEKQNKEFEELIANNQLRKALEMKGYSKEQIRKALEDELTPFVEDDLMSPEEREAREKDAKLKKYEDEEKRKRDEEMSAKERAELDQSMQELEKEFISAVKEVGLPADPWLGKQVAQVMLGAAKNGYDVTAREAAEVVKERTSENLKNLISQMSLEDKRKFLGKDTLSELRKADVDAIKDAERPFAKPSKAVKPNDNQATSEQSKREASDFFNKLRGVNYNKQ